jgi:thermostable 8-oxoguanine DNA glycosylase
MRVQPAEIIDRLTIIKLKIEKLKDPLLKKEFEELKEALEKFKQENTKIKDEWITELYEINKEVWGLLKKINDERNKEKLDYERFGELYLEIEKMNRRRAETKNKIVEETGKGFKEIKKNHPSE